MAGQGGEREMTVLSIFPLASFFLSFVCELLIYVGLCIAKDL